MPKIPFNVLLVEDNPGDIHLISEILLTEGTQVELEAISNGETALEYLLDKDLPSLPDLLILDINLPKKSGKEILHEISKSEELKKIPVIIFSSADADDDVFTNGTFNIKYYIVKPMNLEDYIESVDFIRRYIESRIASEV